MVRGLRVTDGVPADVLEAQLAPGATAIGTTPNRWLHLTLGQWGQMDSNGAGQQVASTRWYLGRSPGRKEVRPDAGGLYADGMSLYQYGLANPVDRTDPEGLSVAISLMGAMSLAQEVRGRDAAAKTAAGNVLPNTAFWDQIGMTLVGDAFFANAAYGESSDDVVGILDELIGFSASGRPAGACRPVATRSRSVPPGG